MTLICIVIGAIGAASLPFILFIVLYILGFTLRGIGFATCASRNQGPNVAANSLFSWAQSIQARRALIKHINCWMILGTQAGFWFYVDKI